MAETPETISAWTSVATASKIPEGEPIRIKCGARKLALYRVDGQLFATDDICSHAYALLSTGFLEGHEIECPLHGAKFDIRSGECTSHGYDTIETLEVEVRDDEIFVRTRDECD